MDNDVTSENFNSMHNIRLDQSYNCLTCPFCDEIAGKDNLFSRLLGDRLDQRTILESDNFLVWPSIGPIAVGHLLILTKRHILNIGALSSSESEEMHKLRDQAVDLLTSEYRTQVVAFEHGASKSSNGGGCVDHAHLHLITSNRDYLNEFSQFFNWQHISNRPEVLAEWSKKQIPYLYYRTIDEVDYIAVAPPSLPSQFLRQIVSQSLSFTPNWNWRIYPNEEAVYRMYVRLTNRQQ